MSSVTNAGKSTWFQSQAKESLGFHSITQEALRGGNLGSE